MSLSSRMDQGSLSIDAVTMRFSQRVTRQPYAIYLFFEDLLSQNFFLPCVRSVCPPSEEVVCNPCLNKLAVMTVCADLTKRYGAGTRLLFFVDRDFDDYKNGIQSSTTDLYVTSYYSVESYVVDEELVRAVLQEDFCHTYGDSYTDALVDAFRKLEFEFTAAIMPLMVYALCLKARKLSINFNNLALSDIFSSMTIITWSQSETDWKYLSGIQYKSKLGLRFMKSQERGNS